MKIQTNFSEIDKMVIEHDYDNPLIAINEVVQKVYKELFAIMRSLNENDEYDIEIPNIAMSVQKDKRGFEAITVDLYEQRAFVYLKDENCNIGDEHLDDILITFNANIMSIEEVDEYYDNIPIHKEVKANKKVKPVSEKHIEKILCKDLSVIEEGMALIQSQYPVENGYIDILAKDKNNQICIIELKKVDNDSKIIQQCVYYPTQFNEDVRMITITPGYTNKIYTSLRSLGYVEMMQYGLDDDQISVFTYNSQLTK